jgi:hypothetical protein
VNKLRKLIKEGRATALKPGDDGYDLVYGALSFGSEPNTSRSGNTIPPNTGAISTKSISASGGSTKAGGNR